MKKTGELVKNTIIIFVGKLCTQLISFVLLPLYTGVLTSDEYGLVDLITTYASLAIPIVGFQLEMGVFRHLIDNRKHEENKSKLITNSLVIITISCIFFSIIFLILAKVFQLQYSLLILVNAISSLLYSFLLQVARGLGDNAGFSIGSIISGLVAVLLNIIFLIIFKTGLSGVLWASIIANAVGIVFLCSREKIPKYFRAKARNKRIAKELLKYSLPLVPNTLIWWVINVSDRTLITLFLGMSANGIYAVANRFSHIIVQAYGIFNLSWTESAALHIDDGDKDQFFSDVFNATIKIITCLALSIIAVVPILFQFMVGDGFMDAYDYIPILALSSVFNAIVSFIGVVYIAKKKTKQVALTSFWAGVINILTNLALIKLIGLWAASISTLSAFGIMSLYRYLDVKKYVKLRINKKAVIILAVCTLLCIALYYVRGFFAMVINPCLAITISILLNKGQLKTLARAVKTKFFSQKT